MTPTKAECIADAAQCIAEAAQLADTLPLAEAARIAYTPTGPSTAELEQRIAARRSGMRRAS